MKMKLAIAFLASLFAIGLHAQSIPAPNLFTMSGNYSEFRSSSSTTPAVIATAAIQVTPTISVGYEHISVSSASARWELGVVAYTRPLNELLGATLSKKILFDTTKIGVTFSAGAGKLLQPTVNRIAETAGVHFSYPLADHISLQIIGIDYLHGGVQNGFVTTNNAQNISTGLNIYF